jgi:multisubunit Na+/H+ antiporter MnhF subunit
MTSHFDLAWLLAFGLIAAGLAFALARLARGPALIDRLAAADVLLSLVIALVLLIAVRTGERHFLAAAVAVALFALLGNLAFARVLSPGSVDEPEAVTERPEVPHDGGAA